MTVQGALWLAKHYPSTLISVFLTGFRYFSHQVATQLASRGWTPFEAVIYTSRKISRLQPGIEPRTSWIAVRRANHDKSTLEIIMHILKPTQKMFECFNSKPNTYGAFLNLHIKIN